MIVTVRRWTSIALPRLRVGRAKQSKVAEQHQAPEKQIGFLESFDRMFEHQVHLMFKEDLAE